MTISFNTIIIKQTLQTHLQQATHSIEIAMESYKPAKTTTQKIETTPSKPQILPTKPTGVKSLA